MWRRCGKEGRRLFSAKRSFNTTSEKSGYEVSISDCSSNDLVLKTGHMARFADAAVVASRGESAVLGTVVSKEGGSSNGGFVSLSVDFRQSAAAVGKIPTNYLRREMGQSDSDILVSRIIDRSIRPLIPPETTDTIQLQCKPLAVEDDSDEVVLAVNAAAAAMHLSPIPFVNAAAAVRVGMIDGKPIVNPPRSILRHSSLDLLLTGCGDRRVLMIEMDGQEIHISSFEEAVDCGLDTIKEILRKMDELKGLCGKEKRVSSVSSTAALAKDLRELCEMQLEFVLSDSRHDKISRDVAIRKTYEKVLPLLKGKYEEVEIRREHAKLTKAVLRSCILSSKLRCDGRKLDDFRPISIDVDVYPKLHGSTLFQRGQTQVMATCTFDAPSAAFHPDSISQLLGAQRKKSFLLHYEFPGYATNELSTGRGANRRELGHGALAEKALKHVVPNDFPFCIRLACQVLESNGSSSMASVCAGSMALLDAGVPLKEQTAGVAIGLVTDEENRDGQYEILTDLSGIEDYAGDMDFKIAGTRKGFTAMQLDVKSNGLSRQQMKESIERGEKAIGRLLDTMDQSISKPRQQLKDSVPILETMQLESYKRNALFRGGAFNAKLIESETGVKIVVDDESHISLNAPNKTQMEKARVMIREMTTETDESSLSFGQMLTVQVVSVKEGGISVRITPHGKAYWMPNSQLAAIPIQHASAAGIKEGDKLKVQWLGRDGQTGTVRLSRRTLMGSAAPAVNAFKKKN